MNRLKRNGVSWFLEEEEDLAAVVADVVEEKEERRTYRTRNWGDRKVFVKYFVEKGIAGFLRNRMAPRGRLEYGLGKKMVSLAQATPRPLGYGIGAKGSFVLQEWIDGRTFRSAFYAGPQRQVFLDELALLLEQLRTSRIRHNDLHLDNVLVSDKLYLIDLHKTDIKRVRFSRADELVNLAHALNMIYDDMTEEEKSRFFLRYGRPDIRSALEERLRTLRREWIDRKKKRAFATTSRLRAGGNRVYVRGREDRGNGALSEVIKKDKKVRIERHTDHVRKEYRHRRRLVRAWQTHVALEYLGADVVPRPFFVQTGSLFDGGYIVMEDLGGLGEELDRFLDRKYDGMTGAERRRFIEAFSQFLAGLLRKGVSHRDLKACNVFVLQDGFRLLDVEDIVFCPADEVDLKRMLVQLNTSIPRRVTVTDRVRFCLNLTKGIPFAGKGLLREVARASARQEIVYEGVSGLKRESWREASGASRSRA